MIAVGGICIELPPAVIFGEDCGNLDMNFIMDEEEDMFKKLVNGFYVLICSVLIFQFIGCGTIMYPERKGQRAGRIDVGVALLDGIGLFFFLIPGVIAYAVDFSNGTIYLPGTASSSLGGQDIKQVKFDLKDKSLVNIESIVKRETGYDVSQYQNNTEIYKLRSSEEIAARFAKVLVEFS